MAKKEFDIDEIIEVIQTSKYPTPRNDLTFSADQLSDEAVKDLKRKYLELLLSRGQSFAPFGKKLRVFANSTIPTIRADVGRPLPGDLSGLIADVTETSVHLSWAAVSNTSLYLIEFNGEPYVTESLSISFEDLPPGTEYTFKVTPVNNSDEGEGQQIVVVTLLFPDALTGLLVTDVTSDSLMLSWNAALNALGYEVKFGNTTDTTTNLQYAVSGLPSGETYIFNVTPFNDDGRGDGATIEARTLLLPGAINDLVASSVTETSAVLTWSAASNAVSYIISYDGKTLTSDITSIEIDSLVSGTAYTFEVVAVNADGRGAVAVTEVRTLLLPGAINDLVSSSVTETSVELSWNESANATSYEISYGDEMIPSDTTSIVIGSLEKGTTYTFTVTATNDDGRGASATIEVRTLLLPGAINDLVASSVTETSAVLTWSAASDAVSYEISYDGNTLTSDTTSIEIDSLESGTTYAFAVTATNGDGSGDSATTEIRTLLLPGAVNNLVASSVTETSAVLTWAAASNAVSYEIRYGDETITTTDTTFEISSLVSGTAYSFEVVAVNADGRGDSATIEVHTTLLPGVVNDLVSSSITETSAVLSWAAASNAVSYEISYGDKTLTTTDTTLEISELSKGTTYTFTVTTINDDGRGDGATIEVRTLLLPGAVTDLVASSVTETSAVLTWSAASNAVSYEISYGDELLATNDTTFEIGSLVKGTTYTFTVTAINDDGRGVVATVEAHTLLLPGTVNDLVASSITETSAVLTWSAASDATSYVISYDGNTLTSDTTSIDIDSLVKGTTYTFEVIAVNNDGQGAGVPIEVRTKLLPAAVTGLTVEDRTETSIVLSWNESANASSYEISYGDEPITTSTTSFEIDSLSKGTEYTFTVTATNVDGSGDSATVNATTLIIPAAVSDLLATPTDTTVFISWSAVEHATSYEVSYGSTTLFSDEPSITVTELTAETEYTFAVTPVGTDGQGPSTSIVTTTLPIEEEEDPIGGEEEGTGDE